MELFSKNFKEINEDDLYELELNPINFESFEIEYKLKYSGDSDELRRDIIQFANGFCEGYLIFGILNNPIKIVGIDKNEVEILKNILNNILTHKIDPILTPFPEYNVVALSNGKYILLIKIIPKKHGLYGMRLSDNSSNKKYKKYEFYKRMDGNKHQMNVDEIIELIESKSLGLRKFLEVKILSNILLPTLSEKVFISIRAVNKTVRPITITSYGILPVNKEYKIMIFPNEPYNTPLPYKLQDGDSCQAYIPIDFLKEEIMKFGDKFPIDLMAIFNTNDGIFYSEKITLIK